MTEQKVSNEVNDNTSQGDSPAEQTPVVFSPEELIAKISSLEEKVTSQNQAFASMRKGLQTAQSERDLAKQELAERSQQPKVSEESDSDADIDPEAKKVLDNYVKKQGFITQEELTKREQEALVVRQKTVQSSAIKKFLANHPEYDSEEMWQKVDKEASLYRLPSTEEDFDLMFNRIHSVLSGDLNMSESRGADRARAEMHKRSLMAKGSSGSGSVNSNTYTSLKERFPNLSDDQIQQQVQTLEKMGYRPTKLLNK